jgi:hypothetical protein
MVPGRIQTTSKAGFYASMQRTEVYINSSFYLANNPNYTYYWVNFDGSIPNNVVFARSNVGAFALPITRVKENGHVKIGILIYPTGNFVNKDKTNDENLENFELLVCDPWPKYRCGGFS